MDSISVCVCVCMCVCVEADGGLIALFQVLRFTLIKALRDGVRTSGHKHFNATAAAVLRENNDSQLSLFIQPKEPLAGHH